jgi:hypothetical protein
MAMEASVEGFWRGGEAGACEAGASAPDAWASFIVSILRAVEDHYFAQFMGLE